jgi:hypothetical protein
MLHTDGQVAPVSSPNSFGQQVSEGKESHVTSELEVGHLSV